jgi:2-iminobutanoate/2-iminopropanoate deaminase
MRAIIAAAFLLIATPAFAEKTLIEAPDAPKAIGPYSQAIQSGKLVFVSGSLPFDPAGKVDYSKQDVGTQTRRALDNIALELKAAHLTLNDVVSATVYVTDIDDFPAVNAVYASYFHAPYPARAFVQVAKLLRGAKIEISVIAARK